MFVYKSQDNVAFTYNTYYKRKNLYLCYEFENRNTKLDFSTITQFNKYIKI